MKVLQRSRRLARLGGCAALTLGLAGTAVAGSPPAQARATGTFLDRHAAVSWGFSENGELGNGSTAGSALPGGVSGLGDGVVQVAAGAFHGLAVTPSGTVWAWGDNEWGELGDGTFNSSSTPVQVPGLTGVVQVSAGVAYSLALRSDGTVWAWGFNYYGQLGDRVTGLPKPTPVEVTGLTGVTKISAGGGCSLALRSDGTVWAWGYNGDGELGDGTTADSPVPVQVTGLSQVTSISASFGGAALAIRTRGITALTSVWAWGANGSGQFGDGTFTSHLTPEQVTGINTPYIAVIAAGDDFAVVAGTDGSVWGWGDNSAGQLGNAPDSSPVTRPVNTIGTGSGITQLSAGLNHVLALESNRTVLAWGSNSAGQLGDGSTASVVRPVQVVGLANASQVSAGAQFSLAVAPPVSAIVPDLSGDTPAQAGQALQAAGLVLGTVNVAVDNLCNNIGTVMSQNPAGGSTVSFGSAVSITIGKRPPHPCP